jgi:hypothetical protein
MKIFLDTVLLVAVIESVLAFIASFAHLDPVGRRRRDLWLARPAGRGDR